jgi:excisionase family DNA binding protein
MKENLLDSTEVAKRLHCSRSHAYRLMSRGDIPTIHYGKLVRVREEDLDKFMQRWRGMNKTPLPEE